MRQNATYIRSRISGGSRSTRQAANLTIDAELDTGRPLSDLSLGFARCAAPAARRLMSQGRIRRAA